MAKFATNVSGAMLLPSLIQVTESHSGSVVPLAMFYIFNYIRRYQIDNLLVPVLFGLTANHWVQVAVDGAKLPNITDSIGQFIFV